MADPDDRPSADDAEQRPRPSWLGAQIPRARRRAMEAVEEAEAAYQRWKDEFGKA
jgi:hypothetical protein